MESAKKIFFNFLIFFKKYQLFARLHFCIFFNFKCKIEYLVLKLKKKVRTRSLLLFSPKKKIQLINESSAVKICWWLLINEYNNLSIEFFIRWKLSAERHDTINQNDIRK
jgi:hypothetical protein